MILAPPAAASGAPEEQAEVPAPQEPRGEHEELPAAAARVEGYYEQSLAAGPVTRAGGLGLAAMGGGGRAGVKAWRGACPGSGANRDAP